MIKDERWAYFESGELQRKVAIDLIDWAGYWTNTGIDGIESEVQRRQMRFCINQILTDLSYIIRIVATIAMSYPAIKDAVEAPSEADIAATVNDIMSFRIAWVADILPSDIKEE